MADRPIIFSAPMVRALIEGRKTQTRRVLRDPTGSGWYRHPETSQIIGCMGNPPPRLPYAVGDRLYVRETWATVNSAAGPGFAYKADGAFIQPEYDGEDFGGGPSFNYDKYPGEYSMWFGDLLAGAPDHGWTHPNRMPRWASRLTLTVTDVRVQRLQEISEDDARAEGAAWHDGRGIGHSGWRHDLKDVHADARSSFARLWSILHGPTAWDANPWVCAVTFTVERRNIDAGAA